MAHNNFAQSVKSALAAGMKTAGGLFSAGSGSQNVIGNAGFAWQNGVNPFGRFAGSQISWDKITGDLGQSPVATAALAIICENYCQSRIRVETRGADQDKYEPDPDHDLLPLFKHPNDYYSWEYLTRGVITSMHVAGDAYVGIERDGSGLPARLFWLPYGVVPFKEKNSKNLVDAWIFQQGNKETKVPLEDILHFALGADPQRPGFGMSVSRVLKQDLYALQQDSNYRANIMRNNGALGVLLSPKQMKDQNGNFTQVSADPKAVTDLWKSKTQGDKVGEAMYLDFPMDVVFPKNSPQDLAIDTMMDRPEANICAVMRVSILLVGAHGGRNAKTYANYESARTALWEECLLPLQSIIAAELTTQLLPQMGGDTSTERVAYDTSGIRALQPDLDKLHDRVRSDFEKNLIDLYTAEVETKRVPDDAHKGIYAFMLPHVSDTGQVDGGILEGIGVKPKPKPEPLPVPPGQVPPQLPAPANGQALNGGNGTGNKPEMVMAGVAGKSAQDVGERLRRRIAAQWRDNNG